MYEYAQPVLDKLEEAFHAGWIFHQLDTCGYSGTMSAMDKLRQWLKEESKPADIDAKNLSLAQKLLEAKLPSESSHDPFTFECFWMVGDFVEKVGDRMSHYALRT